jgi:hypothetical protein
MARLLAVMLLLPVLLAGARADEVVGTCLSRQERHAAMASEKTVKLAAVIQAMKGRGSREVIRVRLCRGPKGLFYVLTLLGRDGKVTRATVDATNGMVVSAR